ncbi:hypothetical protein BD779DRAFT_32597 [Infundibulicybe gibba]|nr:hypothetical protein BD779DRAFT_32597 [Infundibulicybe gibba]
MPSLFHIVLLALNASIFISLSGVLSTKSSVLASPLPLPSTVMTQNMTNPRLDLLALRGVPSVRPPLPSGSLGNRDSEILLLGQYADSLCHHGENIRSLASQAPDHASDHDYQRNCVKELSQYQSAMSSFQTTLGGLAAKKGLANYDRSDSLETAVKGVVNCHKYTLTAVDDLITACPGLGPLLGPCESILIL